MASNASSRPPESDGGESLYGVDVSTRAGQRAAALIRSIPGSARTKNLERVKALLQEERDPSPVAIYRACHGATGDTGLTPTSDPRVSHAPDGEGFDPAADPTPSTDKIRVQRAYDAARDAGMDETASALRSATLTHQRGLASLLFAEFIDTEAGR